MADALLATSLATAFIAPGVTYLLGRASATAAHRAAVVGGVATFALVLWARLAGGGEAVLRWVPSWGLEAHLRLDGLAALYALVATGVGTVVVVYAGRYIEDHLRQRGQAPRRAGGFHALLQLFMAAMLGLAVARDLLVLFLFFDLTALTSYLLIRFDHEEESSRKAALVALVVTAGSGVLFLAAVAWVYVEGGTLRLEDVPVLPAGIAVLVLVPALAKSAQAPLHFWLPRAMVAPTPVSAYLHSAAMVAAGVFLISRLLPILPSDVTDALVPIGFASIAVGGWIALAADPLKTILAGSTIAQYGYVTVLLGLRDVSAASLYVIAHALAKSALFLTAGTVTEATGSNKLSGVGGLGRELPLLAASSAVAAAGLAGLPLTLGFFKDEVFHGALAERGTGYALLGLAASISTLAYAWRFWAGIFLGPAPRRHLHAPPSLVWPIAFLALLLLVGGFDAVGFAPLASAAGHAPVSAAYHLDLRAENVLALATWGGGLLVALLLPGLVPALARALDLAGRVGPGRLFDRALDGIDRAARWLGGLEVKQLRPHLAYTLVPIAVLVGLAVVLGGETAFEVGDLELGDVPVLLALVVACAGAVEAVLARSDQALVVMLSAVGFTLAALFAFLRAPDVALVAALVETMFTVLLLAFAAPLSTRTIAFEEHRPSRWLGRLATVLAAGFAFVVAWTTLSRGFPRTVGTRYVELAPEAHASNVVSAILADFRGLDTVGEASVLAFSFAAVAAVVALPLARKPRGGPGRRP